MNIVTVVDAIKHKLEAEGGSAIIADQKGGSFTASLAERGVIVDNLGAQPLLPWAAFQEAVCLLLRKGGRAGRGNAMGPRLGSDELPVDSVEGHIAHVVYGKRVNQAVFRRITPIACVLVWAGICEHAPGELVLRA